MASKSIAVSHHFNIACLSYRCFAYQDIQLQGKFYVEPSSSAGKLHTSEWPLLLKVYLGIF
jgi:hypothetical protein